MNYFYINTFPNIYSFEQQCLIILFLYFHGCGFIPYSWIMHVNEHTINNIGQFYDCCGRKPGPDKTWQFTGCWLALSFPCMTVYLYISVVLNTSVKCYLWQSLYTGGGNWAGCGGNKARHLENNLDIWKPTRTWGNQLTSSGTHILQSSCVLFI